mgnify:FL=1
MDWMKKLDKQESKDWEDMMVSFAFDQEEWTDARTTLIDLLDKDQKKADEEAIRSYLSCCAESAGNSNPLPPLSSLVLELYNSYGMDSARER